jgi:hypothetical protein
VSLLFSFVQFEFTHSLGPHAGRYVVASNEPVATASPDPALDARNEQLAGTRHGAGSSDVLVIGVVGAPAAGRRLLRRARQVEPDAPPAEVPLSVATFVKGTQPLPNLGEAQSQLEEERFSEQRQQRWVDEGLRVLNVAIRGHRTGAPDPYAVEVTQRDARRIRIGFGTTEQVQNGLWQQAFELPPPVLPRSRRIERLRPAEAVAAVLSGNNEVLEGEDLLSRALIDLDHSRTRAAAFGVAAAVRLLASELGSQPAPELESLHQRAELAERLAGAAAGGPLDATQVRELESLIAALEDLLDARRYQQV